MKNNTRMPAVAGQFYPSSADELKKLIAKFTPKDTAKQDAIACILPHAGYVYSGKVAVETAANINIKDKIILLGPNHTGYGADFSIIADGEWFTPLGSVKVNSLLARAIMKNCDFVAEEPLGHQYEHSLEVELPILQHFKKEFEIVPIAIMSDNAQLLKKLGSGIAQAIKNAGAEKSTLIVASSDMTHYEPQQAAEKKDKAAIEAIITLDEDKLISKIGELHITMCGYAPAVAMLAAAKLLGAKAAKLIKYQTSGDATGDKTSVVGYAGITIY
ncbi:MAG: AmmeMemoRadiSam system protein B [Candidatus Omnitrophota bacterium]